MCPQLKITQQEQSEDCLNLNIWRPSEINGSESLPVYVLFMVGTLNMAQVLIPTLTVIPSWLKDTIRYTGALALERRTSIFSKSSV
ncbi:carboxylesterase family protein [Vibrio splendidus]|uniref:carboxylesterase family protein n=1 Tax=Vibrio splendidus TaxID=29497 RepID=UPI0021594A7D|nr:carboxylesterase family protein [Vibrio splendidus]